MLNLEAQVIRFFIYFLWILMTGFLIWTTYFVADESILLCLVVQMNSLILPLVAIEFERQAIVKAYNSIDVWFYWRKDLKEMVYVKLDLLKNWLN